MKSRYRGLALSILLMSLSTIASASSVVSENLVFLKEDGRSYLLQRSMRSDWEQYNFYLEKAIGPASVYYVDPPDYTWELDKPNVNLLKFDTGTFTVMYPGNYGGQVSLGEDRVYTLDTRDEVQREDGHFGSWNSPDNFNRFVQAWVFPEVFKILSYESNRDGEWVEQNNTLTFYATDVNDLTFIVRYQLIDADADGVADVNDRCLNTASGVVVDESGCESDSDHDGVVNLHDRCAATPEGAVVDVQGCELDSDADGIVDRLDSCPGTIAGAVVDHEGCESDCDEDGVPNSLDQCSRTPAGVAVNAQGCELDTDGDGVTNRLDECPDTATGSVVNASGCEPDSDSDGVVDATDRCPDTPAGAVVNEQGCELDGDGDGVVDATDRCADTPAGAVVNEQGCELDGDGDGVVDAADRCPDTPAGAVVNEQGCELDGDGDGVVDAADRCPDTPVATAVNEQGCELDTDGDGVVNRLDECPDTEPGSVVNASGCEPDSDNDGVVDAKDLCPDTPAGTEVSAVGCALDSDGDSVLNAADLCPDTPAGVAVDATGCEAEQPIELRGVNFHFDSDELTEQSKVILDGVAEILLNHPELALEVAGHTDAEGDDAFNMDLSQRRAQAVRAYLISKGVNGGNLTAHGYGEERSVASNADAAGRAANRRVELIRLSQ